MPSTNAMLEFLDKVEVFAEKRGLPSAKAGLGFMRDIEELRASESEEKREERELWREKKPEVVRFYKANPNVELDYDDIADACGLPLTRGNRTRIARELKSLSVIAL